MGQVDLIRAHKASGQPGNDVLVEGPAVVIASSDDYHRLRLLWPVLERMVERNALDGVVSWQIGRDLLRRDAEAANYRVSLRPR
jgi:hypothetical protein